MLGPRMGLAQAKAVASMVIERLAGAQHRSSDDLKLTVARTWGVLQQDRVWHC